MSNGATVTIPYSEFQEIQEAKRKAELETAQLQERITQSKIEACDHHLLALADAALEVVRYAVASLPPESNKGWPFGALRTIAERLVHMPNASADHNALAMTLMTFSLECEAHERRRAALGRLPHEKIPAAREATE